MWFVADSSCPFTLLYSHCIDWLMEAGEATLTLSGIDVVDRHWGGLYRGEAYLIYGQVASGRSLLTLLFIQSSVALEEPCLFISPGRPTHLLTQARAAGLDLHEANQAGLVTAMRFPPATALRDMGDEGLTQALQDLAGVIDNHHPQRVVIDDFMPFVQFNSLDNLRTAFKHMLEQIHPLDATLLLVMPEPANPEAHRIIDFISSQMSGAIHVELVDEESNQRHLTLLPQQRHHNRQLEGTLDLRTLALPLPSAPIESLPHSTPHTLKETITPDIETPFSSLLTNSVVEEELDHTDVDTFTLRLQQHFHKRDVKNSSFVLIAMRGDGPLAEKLDFPLLYECILPLLSEHDDWLVNLPEKRLVVVLSDHHADAAQRFFARLRIRLRDAADHEAEMYLHAITAIVVPNGRGFQNAVEFLAVALDES